MNRYGWRATLRSIFTREYGKNERSRREASRRQPDRRIESLEQRRVLAVDFVSAALVDGEPFFTAQADQTTVPLAGTLQESPQQLIVRFTPGTEIDPASLGGITVVRSGGRLDGFGDAGTLPDVPVQPGVLVVDDLPARNQVVIRFAEPLPDDIYRFTIASDVDPGTGEISGLRTIDGQAFRGGGSFSFDVQVSLGPQVVAVVPQPISRDQNDLTADLMQARDTIDVYFNAEESLNQGAAENVGFYKLIEIDDASGDDLAGTTRYPLRVTYDNSSHKASLEFAAGEIADAKLYRLEVGGSGILVDPQIIPGILGDAGSSFDTALAAGVIDEAGVTVTAAIDPEGSIAFPGTLPELQYPTQPGTIDEPGHRDIPIDFSNHGFDELGYETVAPPGTEIFTVPFNFQTHYGNDPQGNLLSNLITAEQKLRVREVFDLFSRYAGVRFVETADAGITVALGDTRVISDNSPEASLEGLWRGSVDEGVPTADALAIVNANRNWGESEYGGAFFRAAMRQVGKVLGLWHSYDVPSVLGDSLPGENVFPSDYDLIHLQQLFPRSGTDIDLYKFSLAEAGTLAAETFASRMTAEASTLDTVLSVFSETHETTARVAGAVTTVVGESAVVQGVTTAIDGALTTVTGVGATVAGFSTTVVGRDLIVAGTETTVVGRADTVVGVAAEVTGSESRVQGVAARAVGTRAMITALAAQVVEAAVATTTVVLDDVSAIMVGEQVIGLSGVPAGTTVAGIDSLANSVVLSNAVTLAADTFLGFGLSGTTAVTAGRFLVSDASAAAVGVPVNQIVLETVTEIFVNDPDAVPAGTEVAGVDIDSGVVSFSMPITVAVGDKLGFGSTTAQLALDDVAAIPVGATLGLPTGDPIADSTRPRVVAVNPGLGVVTLSAPYKSAAGDLLGFDHNPAPELSTPVESTRFFFDLVDDEVVEGLLVSSPQGIAAGTTVEAVERTDRNNDGTDDEFLVTFSQPVTLAVASKVGFGFSGTTIRVADASAVSAGALVEGIGIPENTRVSSVDIDSGEVRLSGAVLVPDGVNVGFSLPETGSVDTNRLVVSQGGSGITVGAPLSDAAGNPLGVSVTRVDGRVITLDGPLSVATADEVFFGVSGRTIYVAETEGIAVGQLVAAVGAGPGLSVSSVDQATGRVMLSGDVTLAHAAAVQFGFFGMQVSVEDASNVAVGASVTPAAGIDAGVTVTKIEGNTLTLSDHVNVAAGSTFTVGAVGSVIKLANLSGVAEGVKVTGAGVPSGARVAIGGIDLVAGTVTLDTVVSVAAGESLGFGSDLTTVELDTSGYDGELVGASISVNGAASGLTVSGVSGTTATLSGTLDVANGDRLAFSFGGSLTTDQIIVADASDITVGGELAVAGVTVTEVDQSSGLVRLSGNVSVSSGGSVTFGYSGIEIVLDDASAAVVGAPLTGVGIPADTFVTAKNGNRVTLSQSVTVADGANADIGFYGSAIALDDATGVLEGVLISGGNGIRPGTSVAAGGVIGNVVTLTQPVRVASGDAVRFGFTGTTVFGVGSTTVTVSDLTGVVVGSTVSGLPGVADGTVTVTAQSETVPGDPTQGGTVTLSSNVLLPDGLELRFGAFATATLTLDDASAVNVGETVSGQGIPAGVVVTGTSGNSQVTLSQSVTVAADAVLGFGTPARELIARNDNAFGRDSFLKLDLDAGNYFVAVTSVGNTDFEPAIEQSGSGGRTEGDYELSLKFKPAASSATTVVDASGTPLDGDRDGRAGGAFNFWFRTAAANDTVYVDKLKFDAATIVSVDAQQATTIAVADTTGIVVGMELVGSGIAAGITIAAVPDGTSLVLSDPVTIDAGKTVYAANAGVGSLDAPYRTIAEAVAAAAVDPSKIIIRVLGNTGDELSGLKIAGTTRSLRPNALAAEIDPHHYYIGLDEAGSPLVDGASLTVPAGVTLMVDAGAVLRMRQANIDVGSSTELVSRTESALQVLGVPNSPVRITSAVQGATRGEQVSGPIPEGGDWGGIVLRADSDWQPSSSLAFDTLRPFLNTINHAVIEYAGGEVEVDSERKTFSAIQLEDARPSLGFNQILRSASTAIAATPNSFLEANGRAGPQLSGNTLLQNSTNGLFIAIRTEFGVPLDTLDVAARFSSTEVTYVLQENLVLTGGQGSYYTDSSGVIRARESGRLTVDPGVVLKLQNARIELERGSAQLIAEGHPTQRVVFTNLGDYRFGAGGTFDTNGNLPDGYGPGRWGGIILNAGSQASIDNAFISSGGGEVPIEGVLDQFNVIEVHQGDLRLANSRLQSNSDGVALTDRTARGANEAATVFVRGAQPVIVGNDFRDNAGATISINANSMNDRYLSDPGRQSGLISRNAAYDDNIGPLIRDNSISYATTEPIVVGYDEPALPPPAELPTDGSVQQIDWNGQKVDVLTNSWVVRASAENAGPISFTAGWSAVDIGDGFYELTAPGASVSDVVAWAAGNATVAYAEPNFLLWNQRLASDPQFDELWGLNNTGQNGGLADADIDAPEAWDITTGSNEVVIAVIDTGVDYTHEDLAANIWVNPGEIPGDGIDNDGNGFVDDVRGWDFANEDNDPMDVDGHGTHVAGTIGAVANNGIGITGVSWNVKILPVKYLDPFGSTVDAIESVMYLTELRQQGINIVASNNSWGGGGYSQALLDAIDAGGEAGILFVAAAGNAANNNDQNPTYPTSYQSDAILSVAATDRNNALAGFSNYGRTSVDIGAPGVDILSTLPGNAYGVYSGTSMAAPHATGVAALVAAANPEATMDEIRSAILNGAVPIPSLTNNVATGALLNASGALAAFSGVSRTAGLVVRGEEIVVNSVWDDADIVHVLQDEIIVNNLHTATSLKLLSKTDASLVIKLAGADAGFTASGELLDIDDRVGGTVQVIGQPGFPVVLTSLYDDSVGASLDAYGFPVTDTNVDGAVSEPGPGDWRSLQFLPLSNDRNVGVVRELELPFTTGDVDANGIVEDAEILGTLAPNYATDGDTWESAQEKSGDENRRLGFDVSGTISFNDSTDVDIYSFDGYAGSEVWIDIDQTTSSLDSMVELLDASGRVLARSANSQTDTGSVTGLRISAELGGMAEVTGAETTVVGSAAEVTGVGAIVVGETESAVGAVTTATGVAALVEGIDQPALGAAVDVRGVAAVVAADTNAATATINTTEFDGLLAGARIFLNGTDSGRTVSAITGNSVGLTGGNLDVSDGDILAFEIGGAPIAATRIWVSDDSLVTNNGDFYVDGVDSGVNVVRSLGFDVVELTGQANLPNGLTNDVGLGFVGNTSRQTDWVMVANTADIGAGPFLGVQVNGVAGMPAGITRVAVGGVNAARSTVRLDQTVTFTGNDRALKFGYRAAQGVEVIQLDSAEFDDLTLGLNNLVGQVLERNGVTQGIVSVVGISGDMITFTGDTVDVAHGDVLAFDFGAGAIDATRVRVADAAVATIGGSVHIDGVDSTQTVIAGETHAAANLVAANVITLSGQATIDNTNDVAVGFNGVAVSADAVRVIDTTGIVPGSPVNGLVGIPAGTLVSSVDAATGTIGFDQTVTLAGGTLAFGFNGGTVVLDTVDLDGVIANGASVTRNGVVDPSISVNNVAGNVLTFNGTTNAFADGDEIGLFLNGAGQSPVSYDRLYFDDAALAASLDPGAVVEYVASAVDGSTTILTAPSASGMVSFDSGLTVSNDDLLVFGFVGNQPVMSSRAVVVNSDPLFAGVGPAVLVTMVGAGSADQRVPDGTSVNASPSVTPDPTWSVVELDRSVTIASADVLGFGFNGTDLVLADVTGLNSGEGVAGPGVQSDTAIDVGGVDSVTNTIRVTQAASVEDAAILTFSQQEFSILAAPGATGLSILPGSLAGIIYDGETAIQTFVSDRDGTLTFTPIGNPPSRVVSGTVDFVTGNVSVDFDVPPRHAIGLEVDYDYSNIALTTLGFEPGTGNYGAYPLTKDAWRGGDFYTTNPRDAGMRVTLPGTQGTKQKYFIRVRSQPEVGTDRPSYEANLVQSSPLAPGQTSGHYDLSVRLRQRDEAPGSTVRFADIRYPVTGIDVMGLPNNSPLVGTTGEYPNDGNDVQSSAQPLGNLLTSDRNTISVAGTISDEADVDWYTFTMSYEDIQSLLDHNDTDKTWATVFDIDYADGFRGDLTLSVFDATGELIYVGRDSDIADDQPGPGQAGGDVDDLSRGSFGKLDPFIGSVQLPAGSEAPQTYYVAVSSNERLPSTLDQTFVANATNPLVRLEPISSLNRIAEDHIDYTGYTSNGQWIDSPGLINLGTSFTPNGDIPLSANVRPFTLADVTLFVSTGGSLFTIDPFTGRRESTIANYGGNSMADLDMLTNGTLVTYVNYGGGADLGTLQTVNPADGARSDSAFGGDGIKDDASGSPPPADNVWAITGSTPDAVAIRRTGVANYTVSGNFGAGSSPIVYSVRDSAGLPGTRSVIYGADNSGDATTSTASPQAHTRGRMGYVPTGVDLDTLYPFNNNDGTTITGFTTGLQYRNENGSLYGVSGGGQFYQITQRNATPGSWNTELTISDARDFSGLLGGSQLAGLATAPVNLEGGRYQGMFFAITTAGELICIDPDGNGAGDAALVDNVFDTDGDGIADSHISTPSGGGVTGLAFSPLDTNLWHPTLRRRDDPGHGTTGLAPDNTRPSVIVASESMRFGLEEFGVGNTYITYSGQSGQYGVVGGNAYNWQQDLTAGSGDANFGSIGNNYNLPGGAHGSLQTNSFSLVGYAATDKPTLYFNYFLETEGAEGSTSSVTMRDSARVVASRDGGVTWELLATNNSIRSGEDGVLPRAELPPVLSASSQIGNSQQFGGSGPRLQQVQELFDNTGSWRQARVDLGHFAGESSVLLRFDFSTAGELDLNDNATIEPQAERSVAVDATLNTLTGDYGVVLDSVAGLQVGMLAVRAPNVNRQTLAVAGGVAETPEGPATIVAIDAVTNTVTLTADDAAVGVTFVAGEHVSFFAAGPPKNNIQGNARIVGNFVNTSTGNSGSRSQNNEFEGFYVDDILIGFAERGEMVTYDGGTTTATTFFDIGTPTDTVDYPQQTLTGEYQLEIRRGAEFADMPFQTAGMDWHNDSTTRIIQRFDTNDRFVEAVATTPLTLQSTSFTNADIGNVNPIEVTGRGNGAVTPDPYGVGDDAVVALRANPSLTTTSHTVADWGVDLQGQPEAVLRYTLDMFDAGIGFFVSSNNEVFTPLPNTFTYIPGDSVNGGLPSGDGIAVDLDGTGNWITVDQFGVFGNSGIASFFGTANGSQGERWIDLVAKIQATDPTIIPDPVTGSIFTADTRVAFFHTGRRSDGDGTIGGYNGGVVLSEVEILTTRPVETTGTIGDANNVHEFEQGQFVIQSNFVTAAASYGVRIDASRNGSDDPFGNYVGVTNEPDLGVARNLPVLNNSRLVPGAVVSNNVISGAGVAGVIFGGVTNSDVQPQSVVPYGRIVNNTIYGGADSATVGIDVNENAGPTILNNVFAELAVGIQVDGSSRLDSAGNQRTVIGTSAFYAVGVEVSGADQNLGVTLSKSPFMNGPDGNFYPVTGTAIVDSSLSSLQDRNKYRVVTESVGINPSPIVAPLRDIYGQLRVDDPQQANEPGLGGTVFQDRGAVERVDQSRPFGRIVLPLDQGDSPLDTDGSVDSVVIEGPDARGVRTIAIQLTDFGVGIDKSTVSSDAFVVTRDGVRLLDTIDYRWVYNENTDQVLFRAISVFPMGEYLIEVNSTAADSVAGVAGKVTDRANNPLRSNADGGRTTFFVALADVPGQVNGLQGIAGDGEITIEWNPPLASLAKPVIDYTVQWIQQPASGEPDWTTAASDTVTETSFTATGLSNNTPYLFRVTARNAVGSGAPRQESTAIVPRAPATAPQNLNGAAGVDGTTKLSQVALDWDDLSVGDLGSNTLIDFRVEYRLASEADWIEQLAVASTTSAAVVDANGAGLTPAEDYVFRVTAITEVAESGERVVGAYSAEVTVTAEGLPAAPTGLVAAPNGKNLEVSWTAPDDGGQPIDDYIVQINLSNPSSSPNTWLPYDDGASAIPGATLADGGPLVSDSQSPPTVELPPGKDVWVRVKAVNIHDSGDFSASSARFTMPDVPSGNLAVTELTPADRAVTIKWSYVEPSSSSEAPVTNFLVSKRVVGEPDFDVPPVEIDALAPLGNLDTRIVNGTKYEFKIVAENAVELDVSQLDNGTLANGTAYEFKIVAKNAVEQGASIITAAVTPRTTPDAPANLAGTRGDRRLTLNWDAPANDGGTPVIDYEVQYRLSDDVDWTPFSDGTSTQTEATVTGLVNGQEYEVRVRARTAEEGAWVQAGPFMPQGLSAPPTAVVATVPAGVSGTVNLSWNVPAETGGALLTGYEVEGSTDGGISWDAVPASVDLNNATAVVDGLIGGVGYNFRVAAETSAGTGVFSVRSNLVVPIQAAPAPLFIDGAAEGGTGTSIQTYNTPSQELVYAFTYNSLAIPDSYQIRVTAGGQVLLDLSGVSEGNTEEILKPSGVQQLTVEVTGGGEGTAWSYELAPKPSSNSVAVAWSAPSQGYGSAVADYQVEWVELDVNDNPLTETTQRSFTANMLGFVASGLNAETKYQFRVRAKLVTGMYGDWSEVSVHETAAT